MKYEMEIGGYPIELMLSQGRNKPRVGLLGPSGTYTEEAGQTLLGDQFSRLNVVFLKTNILVVNGVDQGDYDLGIAPIENSTEGDVMEVLRAMVRTSHTTAILGETIRRIEHILLGQSKGPIEELYSHPQALGQCSGFIAENYPGTRLVPADSTAKAAELVVDKPYAVAIASRRVAQKYQLPILAENIGDIKDNTTRFVIIGKGETFPTGQDSTALVIEPLEDRPGILADYLNILKAFRVNLTKIDSHPTGRMRRYLFRVIFDGHQQDPTVNAALRTLKATPGTSLRLLGSYRKAEIPEGVREPGVLNGN